MDYEWRLVAALVVSYAFLIWAAITFLRIFNSWMKRRHEPAVAKAKPLKGPVPLSTTPNASSTLEAPGEPRIHPVGKGGTGAPAWRPPSSGSDENGKVAAASKSETDG